MAISIRMATLMQLHREETYVLQNPTRELIIRAESARRTLVCIAKGQLSSSVVILTQYFQVDAT